MYNLLFKNWLNNKIQSLINEYKTQHKQKNKFNSKSVIRKQAIKGK